MPWRVRDLENLPGFGQLSEETRCFLGTTHSLELITRFCQFVPEDQVLRTTATRTLWLPELTPPCYESWLAVLREIGPCPEKHGLNHHVMVEGDRKMRPPVVPLTELGGHSDTLSWAICTRSGDKIAGKGHPVLKAALVLKARMVSHARSAAARLVLFKNLIENHHALTLCPGGLPCCLRGLASNGLGTSEAVRILCLVMAQGSKVKVRPDTTGSHLSFQVTSQGLVFYYVRPDDTGELQVAAPVGMTPETLFHYLPRFTVLKDVQQTDGSLMRSCVTPVGPGLFWLSTRLGKAVCVTLPAPLATPEGWVMPPLFSMPTIISRHPPEDSSIPEIPLRDGYRGGESCFLRGEVTASEGLLNPGT